MYASQNEMSVYSGKSDNESIDDMDSSFVLSESDSSSCTTLIQMTIKMIQKARGIYCFLVVFGSSFRKMFYLL